MTTIRFALGLILSSFTPMSNPGRCTEAVFAIDLGAIAIKDPNVPVANRDPHRSDVPARLRPCVVTECGGRAA